MVHVGHLTLCDAWPAQLVLFQESKKDAIIPVELGPDGLFVAGILLPVPFLAPILDEPIVLDLNHLVPLRIRKPEPGHGQVFERLETSGPPGRLGVPGTARQRGPAGALLGFREG